MKDLHSAIIKTLFYFDLNDHPLTLLEVFKFLVKEPGLEKADFEDTRRGLEYLCRQGQVKEVDGFYCLPNRQELVRLRLDRYRYFLTKSLKAVRLIKILKYVPYIRGVALSGSLAGMYPKVDSDIDLLVITKAGRIWLGRTMLTLTIHLLGMRRHGHKISDRICLNHYVAEGCRLSSDHTLYSAMEYANLLVLLGEEAFKQFYRGQDWLEDFLVNPPASPMLSSFSEKKTSVWQKGLEAMLEVLGAPFWEKLARKWQQKRIEVGPTVLVSDDELSFHPDSKGMAHLERYQERVNN